MEAAQNTFISSTFWTERIGPVAGLTLKLWKKNLVIINIGEKVSNKWKELFKKYNLDFDIGGIKPIPYFNLNYSKINLQTFIIKEMLWKGFWPNLFCINCTLR